MSGPVVVEADGSPSSRAAVEAAAWEADRHGVDLRLAHGLAWPAGDAFCEGGAISALRRKYPEVRVRPHRGRTRRALLRAAAAAQLVVVGTYGRRGLPPGSAGRTLLRHAHCSVAVVPPGRA
ncbi:universal stress protein [Streptomyces sp. NPDC059629]|uniref:universal stress protein n=1 Tax=Streptomyces sp. NPDC059629 TaxID=3346889 RepID=UPI003699541B